MNHFNISIFKSLLRILGSTATVVLVFINIHIALFVFAVSYGVAEILGILEEVFDKRKE